MGNLTSSEENYGVDTFTNKPFKKQPLPGSVVSLLQANLKNTSPNAIIYISIKNINDMMMPELCEWMKLLNGKMHYLVISMNKITSTGACKLLDTLRLDTAGITKINLSGNQIDDGMMDSLCNFIKENPVIDSVWIGNNKISDAGLEILCENIQGNASLRILDISDNKGVTNASLKPLMDFVDSSNIENVDIRNTSITKKNALFTILAVNCVKNGTENIILRSKELVDDDVAVLCKGFKKHKIDNMKNLDLSENRISSKGASLLFDALCSLDAKVNIINLNGNHLDDECADSLGEYIKCSEYLQSITLGNNHEYQNNQISDKGIEKLADYIIGTTTLRTLGIHGHYRISESSLPNLTEIAKMSGVMFINLYQSQVSYANQDKLNALLKIPIEEREIPLKSVTKSAAKRS